MMVAHEEFLASPVYQRLMLPRERLATRHVFGAGNPGGDLRSRSRHAEAEALARQLGQVPRLVQLPAEARDYLARVFLRLRELRPLPPANSEDPAVPGGPAMRHRTPPPARRRPSSPAAQWCAAPPAADAAGGQSGGRRKRSLASSPQVSHVASAAFEVSPPRRRRAPPSPVPVVRAMVQAAVVLATVVRCAPGAGTVRHDACGAACFDVGLARPLRRQATDAALETGPVLAAPRRERPLSMAASARVDAIINANSVGGKPWSLRPRDPATLQALLETVHRFYERAAPDSTLAT